MIDNRIREIDPMKYLILYKMFYMFYNLKIMKFLRIALQKGKISLFSCINLVR